MSDEKQANEPERPQSANKSGLDQAAKYSELALIMPAGIAAGWLIGALLDRQFHTHWIFLVGIVLGFIAGFVQIIRIAMKSSK